MASSLSFVKLCILFCLVPRASVLHGTRECCMTVSLLHDAPWSFCFYFLQKVSGQQILEVYLQNFEWILSFSLRLDVHIHAYGKSNLKVQKTWIPECLPLFYFIINFFSQERYFFQRVFIFFLLLFSTFFVFQQNSTKVGIKLYEREGVFSQILTMQLER